MRFFAAVSVFFIAAVGVFAWPVAERQTTQSVATILTDLSNTVTPLANQLLYATPQNATKEDLTPIIGDMNTAVTSAVSKMKGLQGQSKIVIMASADGTTTLEALDIAGLLAGIVNLIFGALGALLKVVDSTIESLIYDLCAALGQVVLTLLSIVISLVGGLLGPLLSLLAPVLSIIASLGLGSLLGGLLGGVL